jgi:hypothetical protein
MSVLISAKTTTPVDTEDSQNTTGNVFASGFDDIDWTTDCIGDSDMASDIQCDINEMLDSIDFETFTTEFDSPHDHVYKESITEISVGQPTYEVNDKSSFERLLNKITCVDIGHSSTKKYKGPSNRNSKKKSKGLPKRPLSAYNLFFQSERLIILEEAIHHHRRISFESLAKLVGQRWHDLSDEQVEKFRELSQLDIARYRREMKLFHQRSADVADNDGKVSSFKLKKASPRSPRSTPTTPRKKRRFSEGSSDDGEPSSLGKLKYTKTCSHTKPPIDEAESSAGLSTSQDLLLCDTELGNESNNINKTDADEVPTPSNVQYLNKRNDDDITETCSLPTLLNIPLLPVTKSSVEKQQLIMPQELYREAQVQRGDLLPSDVSSQHILRQNSTSVVPMSRLSTPQQTPWYTATQYPTLPTYRPSFNHAPFQRQYRVPPFPATNEVMIYDPKLGRERPYMIQYKCYAMKRSEAYDYVHRFSRPNYVNGRYNVPVEQLLQVPQNPPPGVEVNIPFKIHFPQQPGIPKYHYPVKKYQH